MGGCRVGGGKVKQQSGRALSMGRCASPPWGGVVSCFHAEDSFVEVRGGLYTLVPALITIYIALVLGSVTPTVVPSFYK